MIIARISSGLGNQLFQYSTARALSIRLRCRLFFEVGSFGDHEPRKFELHRFNIFGDPAGRIVSALARRRLGLGRSNLRGRMARLVAWTGFSLLRDEQRGYDARLEQVRGNCILSGHWESERYFSRYRETLLRELSLKESPEPRNALLLSQVSDCNAVCVHVRRGDKATIPAIRAVHGVCPLSYYDKAVEIIRQSVGDPVFYVFSDDPDWARAHLKLWGRTELVAHNVGKNDHEDLRIMKACKHFIIANSSFSWWAAWLSEHRGKMVIAPERWFAVDHPAAADLVPQGWMRI